MRGNNFFLYSVCAQLSLAHTEYLCTELLFVYTEYTRNGIYFIRSMRGIVFSLYSVYAEVFLTIVCRTKFSLYRV